MSLLEGIPQYSIEAELAIPVLYKSYSNLIIYVEDTDRVNIYETILSRVLNKEIDFNSIRPTGGKTRMKEIFSAADEQTFNTCFFIADLDFDKILNREMIKHPNFIYLKRYSIENYLVDENVGIEFVNGRLGRGKKRCKELLNFRAWLNELQILYKPLISLFVIVQKLEIGLPNSKTRAEEFITNSGWKVDKNKLRRYFQEVAKAFDQKGEKLIPQLLKTNREISEMYSKDYWRIIPGKQLLTIFIRFLTGYTNNKRYFLDDFIHQASKDCDITELMFIKERIDYVLSIRDQSNPKESPDYIIEYLETS